MKGLLVIFFSADISPQSPKCIIIHVLYLIRGPGGDVDDLFNMNATQQIK